MPLDNITNTSTQILPQSTLLPPFLSGVFTAFHWVHSKWYWYNKGKMYLQPSNFGMLFSGQILSCAVADSRFFQLFARCFQVSKCILICVERQESLYKSYIKTSDAILGRYPLAKVHKWRKQAMNSLISPSTSQAFYVWFFDAEHYFRHLIYRIAKLGKNIFTFSMSIMDASEAMDPNSGEMAVKEFFINSKKCLGTIADNREIVDKLRSNKSTVSMVLANLYFPCEADQLIEFIDSAFSKAQTANNFINRINDTVGYAITETAKSFAFLTLCALGLSDSAPDALVPTWGALDVDNRPIDANNRYAPICQRKGFMQRTAPPAIVSKKEEEEIKGSFITLEEAYAEALKDQKN